jgi:hypothetical protein
VSAAPGIVLRDVATGAEKQPQLAADGTTNSG